MYLIVTISYFCFTDYRFSNKTYNIKLCRDSTYVKFKLPFPKLSKSNYY